MLSLRILFGLFFLAGLFPAQAYVRTMSSTGRPLFWSNPNVTMQANPMNSSGLTAAQVDALLTPAFQAWSIPGTSASFSYFQSTSNPAASNSDGINSVYFASRGGRNLGYGVVAVTEVLYYINDGRIAEADMVFNDNQFVFTGTEGDTGKTIGGRTAIYLRDVATHEAGHVMGLDHSLVNLSSMIYTAFSGQFNPSGDDNSGIRTLYPSGGGSALTGTVRGTNGGIFGAHVQALNLETGKVEAGAIASSDGSFRIGDIPTGKYAVMMEPFGADIFSVSSYYQNVDHRFCGFSNFRRRFYSACGSQGAASVLNLGGGSIDLGTLAPSCSSMGNPGGPPSSIATAREVPNSGGAAWGQMRPGDTHYYIVRNVSGLLKARVFSYSVYSPVDVRATLLTSAGAPLAGATSVDNIQDPGPGNVVNFDSQASATVANGDYLIQVTSAGSRIPASKFSAGFDLVDGDGHYLLALSVDGEFGPTSITDMSSCVSVANRIQSATFKEVPTSDSKKIGGTGCGSLSSGPGGPFSGGMMMVFLTAMGTQLLSLAVRLRRKQKRQLVRTRR